MIWPFRRKPSLSPAAVMLPLDPPPSGYTDLDRSRDFRRLFLGSPEGRRVLFALLERCKVAEAVFLPGLDSHMAAARDGERNIGRFVLHELTRPLDQQRPETAQTD